MRIFVWHIMKLNMRLHAVATIFFAIEFQSAGLLNCVQLNGNTLKVIQYDKKPNDEAGIEAITMCLLNLHPGLTSCACGFDYDQTRHNRTFLFNFRRTHWFTWSIGTKTIVKRCKIGRYQGNDLRVDNKLGSKQRGNRFSVQHQSPKFMMVISFGGVEVYGNWCCLLYVIGLCEIWFYIPFRWQSLIFDFFNRKTIGRSWKPRTRLAFPSAR